LKGAAALGSASGASGCVATTTRKGNGGRKKRESENRERDGASKHLDFFVERRNCLKSRTEVCSTAEYMISSVAPLIHF
jgi:hypothetical protein